MSRNKWESPIYIKNITHIYILFLFKNSYIHINTYLTLVIFNILWAASSRPDALDLVLWRHGPMPRKSHSGKAPSQRTQKGKSKEKKAKQRSGTYLCYPRAHQAASGAHKGGTLGNPAASESHYNRVSLKNIKKATKWGYIAFPWALYSSK